MARAPRTTSLPKVPPGCRGRPAACGWFRGGVSAPVESAARFREQKTTARPFLEKEPVRHRLSLVRQSGASPARLYHPPGRAGPFARAEIFPIVAVGTISLFETRKQESRLPCRTCAKAATKRQRFECGLACLGSTCSQDVGLMSMALRLA